MRPHIAKLDSFATRFIQSRTLTIIGPGWLEARDEEGKRRLENPQDFVRIEIGTALKRGIPIIPILLEGTRIPKTDQLPDDLRELTLRNGLNVRHVSFLDDLERFIRGLKREASRKAEEERKAAEEAEARRKAEEEAQRKATEEAEARRRAEEEREAAEEAEARRRVEDEAQRKAEETATWFVVAEGEDKEAIEAFLEQWPNGQHADTARARIAELRHGTGGTAPMTSDPDVERLLAAVAFVDVADFSRLMELDDVQTMLKWKILRRELLEPKLAEHRGRLLRAIGDSLFVEFRSAVDAVRWADAVQRGIGHIGGIGGGESLRVRIGINVEDVIVDGDDVLGDGVNIAAPIQRLAEPGETFLTAAVHDYVWNKAGLALVDLGERELKNIGRPVQLYKLEHSSDPESGPPRTRLRPAWSNRPSIAVLHFSNLRGNPKEDYFGEGMTEDIIAALACSRSLFVIARNSTLRYRDGPADAKQIASELGVRYLLEGSVRRQSQRLRISADLINARLNRTIWADRYDGVDDDLFEFQDRIASSIVATIEQWLYEAEAERVRSKPTGSLDAYDCVLRAMPLLHAMENVAFQRAAADGGGARDHARRAMEIDPKDPFVLAVAGHVQGFLHKQPEFAAKLFDRAIELNENSAFAWGLSVLTYCYLSKPDEALERFSRAWQLSPFDPLNYFYLLGAGMAEFLAGRYEQALPWLHKALRVNGRFLACHRQLTTCLAHLGRLAEARAAAAEVLALEPSFRVSTFASWYPLRPPENLERYVAGLRMAGLPE